MRKLFVLALAVMVGVMIFGQADYTQEDLVDGNWVISGNVTMYVAQWLDAAYSPSDFNVYDYGNGQSFDVGTFYADSNAQFTISVEVTGEPNGFTVNKIILVNNSVSYYEEFNDGQTKSNHGDICNSTSPANVKINANVGKDLPANSSSDGSEDYELTLTFTITPSVTL